MGDWKECIERGECEEVSFVVPSALLKSIDKYLGGYEDRDEFFREAVRLNLRRYQDKEFLSQEFARSDLVSALLNAKAALPKLGIILPEAER